MNKLGRNGKYKRLAIYAIAIIAFLVCWFLLTLIILLTQETIFSPLVYEKPKELGNYQKGVQVVVGHYNGNLPAEKLKNITFEELNANNYNPVQGYGEDGRPVYLNTKEELDSENIFGINQFNLLISDRIALNRSLPDVRRVQCRKKTYPHFSQLPTTSVIIVYHNEAFSTLTRTITSVINRSPREVLNEIILVDDFSTRTFLKNELDQFVNTLPVRVKIVRAKTRVGLIRARLMGAAEAGADVLTFLDSHCECTKGWLEPLLSRIKENRKAVVCPIIDVINDRTFSYQKGIELFRGGFNWNLQFRWYALSSVMAKRRAQDPTAPISSPTMAGGLFSIDRKYFEELGTYDPGMNIWGGENIEISFRIWQCGGSVEILPCSHVGHIFRKSSPHDFPKGTNSGKVLNGNLVRVSEVWMDEWKYLFYKIVPQAAKLSQTIDVSDRIELKKKLFCKDFSWYLQNVWPEHFMPTPNSFFGRLVHLAPPQTGKPFNCLRWVGTASGVGHTPTLYFCKEIDGNSKNYIHSVNQNASKRWDKTELWIYSKSGQLKSDEHQCLSATQVVFNTHQYIVQLKECSELSMEYWDYNNYYRTFVHRDSGLCLDEPIEMASPTDEFLTRVPSVLKCRRGKISQQWEIRSIRWLPDNFAENIK